ncbi:TNF receptor-associated factor homolog 1a-like isoform X2 [Phragmites australis]|uniref:TNF receptor-associated factor homolog 1a-like isoform X2 n=1 Tax=Phragmites australis TaxID=29695 RepID=UPI002D78250F|nr:TNF receptor-associated factor homolog 1a-like isoform X2 [Phragmites australis]
MMAGAVTIGDSVAGMTGLGDEDRSMCGGSLSEGRSCEQVDNGSPSTSPPFWDTDGEDDDPGPRPSDLFGRYTWRIENFSKEKKREMKSESFEAGGYKWYILVYPQGCDVSNHLSLFLCVANHDKLLPGWSHFAQFTIAVGNLDPKKAKYSDTLHRFWKKEHDWGWKKFMELSKIQDGFLVDDVLEIIAQVQVIREKVDRPFRCLDRPYQRELLRVYMTNTEQIYRHFVEEHRSKLIKLIEDKMRWSSFRAFWLANDPTTRFRMSREKSDVILKIVVKHFFVEKEVTSTLVMDALYMGLKALEHHNKGKKGTVKLMDLEELSAPMVHVDIDMFVLAGDFIALLERAALEPLSCQPLSLKDDKCSQSRSKDGGSGEVNNFSIEREERRLTELGQKILETFVLSHIFSGIEVAYQEAVALKRQEELIREEELLENEMKGKRGNAIEKDKRAKKKQAKQKKNNHKVKDKEREEKSDSNSPERGRDGTTNHDRENSNQAGKLAAKGDNSEEVNDVGTETKNVQTGNNSSVEIESLISSVSATVSSIRGKINNLLDGTIQISPNRGKTWRNRGIISMSIARVEDDLPSSSSSVSVRNTFGCGPAPKHEQETALLTLKDRLRKLGQRLHEKEIEGRELLKAHLEKKAAAEAAAGSSSASSSDSLEKTPQVPKGPEQTLVTISDANIDAPPPKAVPVATSDATNGAVPAIGTSTVSTKSVPIFTPTPSKLDPVLCKEHVSSSSQHIDRATSLPSRSALIDKAIPTPPKSPLPQADTVAKATPAPPKSSTSQIDKVAKAIPAPPKSPAPEVDKVAPHNSVSRQIPSTSISKAREDTVPEMVAVTSVPLTPTPTSRPSSAPLFQARISTVPPTHTVQFSPLLSRSRTVSGRPSDVPSPSAPSYVTQAYRNAILGTSSLDTTSVNLEQLTSIGQNIAVSQPLPAYALTTSVMVPPVERNGQLPGKQGFMFGLSKSEALDNWHPWKGNGDVNRHMWRDDTPNQQMTNCNVHVHPWKDNSYQQASSCGTEEQGRFVGLQYRQLQREIPARFVSQQQQGPVGEEFPHLDIINDLLDDEQSSESVAVSPLHEHHTFGLPFSSRGNVADSEMASVSRSGWFNLTDHYYDEGYRGAYDTQNALHRLRDEQLSTSDVYSSGRFDSTASKPWLYSRPNPAVNLGTNSNVFSQQMRDYANLASGRVNGEYPEYLYRRANGQW